MMSLSVGSPAKGWQRRAKKLRPSADLRIKPSGRHAMYGHPALVLMLQRTASQMRREAPGATLLVGDLSTEFGGPLSGHHSHQSGRDADVGFFVVDSRNRPQELDHFVAFDASGKAKDGSGLRFDDCRNWLMIQMWLRDQRAVVKYVFVATVLRQRLLDSARRHPAFRKYVDSAATLLIQPRNSSAHDDHFHVRIACPSRHEGLCQEQGTVND
ncbi:MAG: penicillin-insensitive murein endopeptidase [Polyangiaceae bacterium]|nr:penicillin-insensitive murein endopeptidase [Polyangiaceae bacterium]